MRRIEFDITGTEGVRLASIIDRRTGAAIMALTKRWVVCVSFAWKWRPAFCVMFGLPVEFGWSITGENARHLGLGLVAVEWNLEPTAPP